MFFSKAEEERCAVWTSKGVSIIFQSVWVCGVRKPQINSIWVRCQQRHKWGPGHFSCTGHWFHGFFFWSLDWGFWGVFFSFFPVTFWIFVPDTPRGSVPAEVSYPHLPRALHWDNTRQWLLVVGLCSSRSSLGLPCRSVCQQVLFTSAKIWDAIFPSLKSKCWDCRLPWWSAEL